MVKYSFNVANKQLNKLVIPSILAATVLIAGMFALMPVEKASTVHTTIIANQNAQVTYSLDGLIGSVANPGRVVVLDTTNVGSMASGHIAAVLPNADDTCNAADNPAAGVTISVGIAGGVLAVLQAATNTGLDGGPDVTFGGVTVAMCVFHFNFTANAGGVPAAPTDVVVGNAVADRLPDNASITVIARLQA